MRTENNEINYDNISEDGFIIFSEQPSVATYNEIVNASVLGGYTRSA